MDRAADAEDAHTGEEHQEYLQRLSSFLRDRYPECVPMPTQSNAPWGATSGKNPLRPHKHATAEELWAYWDGEGRWNCGRGLLILLRGGLIVFDVDDEALATELEARFPALATTAIQKTRKGRHYFMERTGTCDDVGLFDQAGALFDPATREPLPIDIKTACSTGTGGAISVAPSPGKSWLRPPYDFPPIPVPDDFLVWVIARHRRFGMSGKVGPSQSQSQTQAQTQARRSRHQDEEEPPQNAEEERDDDTTATSDVRTPRLGDDDARSVASSSATRLTSASFPATSASPFEVDADTVQDLVLRCLSPERAEGYATWIEVGIALKHACDGYYGLWVEFSKRGGAKFKGEGECAAKWQSFDNAAGNALSIGSIIKWAQQDDPVTFADVMDTRLYGLVLKCDPRSHSSIARVVAHLYSDQTVCVSAPRKWYSFGGHRWVPDNGGRHLWKRLRDDLPKVFSSMAALQQRKMAACDDEGERKSIAALVARMNAIVVHLGNERFKDAMVRECAMDGRMSDEGFANKLDADDALLGFENGVYDLEAGEFRAGRPEDMVGASCGYAFAMHDDQEIQEDIRAFVASTQASREMEEYLWLLMAYMLHGNKYLEKLWFWVGNGRNGKGTVSTLLSNALGDYFYAPDAAIFMQQDRNASAAKPEIAMLRGKRMALASEPEDTNGASFKVARLKKWRGNDIISTRQLYQNTTSFKPQFGICIAMNDEPALDKVDHAIATTLRIVRFPFEFVEASSSSSPKTLKPHQRPMDCGIKERFNRLAYRQQFMRMLLKVYARNRETYFGPRAPIPEPPEVLAATQAYIEDNDTVARWLQERYETSEDTMDRFNFATLMEAYVADNRVAPTSRPTRRAFKRALENCGLVPASINGRVVYTHLRRKEDAEASGRF